MLFVPPALRRPEILDLPGMPEVFCDMAIVADRGETVRILLGAELAGSYSLVGKVIMPHSGFRRALLLAIAETGIGLVAH